MLEGAVTSEPVSEPKFPVRWENNRVFIDFWLNLSKSILEIAGLDQELIVQIPYGTEQGIIFGLSGN